MYHRFYCYIIIIINFAIDFFIIILLFYYYCITIIAHVNVIGYIDSPYYIDVIPFSTAFVGFPYEEQNKYNTMNTTNVLSSLCITNYTTSTSPLSSLWKCQMGQYRMPFLKTPYFFVASRYDSYQLGIIINSTSKNNNTLPSQ